MKNIAKRIAGFIMAAAAIAIGAQAEKLVILHTNDTHSNIDINPDGTGGVLPRKAIIDSVRKAEKNTILIDAGDMVQGTLYFNYFRGDVEYPLFNMMGYDIRILGNHEFDNGLNELVAHWKRVKGDRLSANYDFSDTPAKGIFKPYVIKKIGGKKIGFMGINIDPESLIISENYAGMKYSDAITTANRVASELKRKGCDLVAAVTHIGYTTDVDKATDIDLARESRDIDIIIGGHSHTFVDPSTPEKTPYWIKNAAGRPVLVAQTGKYGRNIEYISIDLDNLDKRGFDYEYIPVTDRFSPSAYDKEIAAFLAPYKAKVDSVNNHVIGRAAADMSNSSRTGAYPNWGGDFALWYGRHVADSLRRAGLDIPEVEIGMINVGGIRQPLKKGDVTEGKMLATFPFSNYLQLISIKGSDFAKAMQAAFAKGGEGVSGTVRVVGDSAGNVKHVIVGDKEIDPDKEYIMATIDYLSGGNDGLTPLANHRLLWTDREKMNVRVLDYIRMLSGFGLPIEGDPRPRFITEE